MRWFEEKTINFYKSVIDFAEQGGQLSFFVSWCWLAVRIPHHYNSERCLPFHVFHFSSVFWLMLMASYLFRCCNFFLSLSSFFFFFLLPSLVFFDFFFLEYPLGFWYYLNDCWFFSVEQVVIWHTWMSSLMFPREICDESLVESVCVEEPGKEASTSMKYKIKRMSKVWNESFLHSSYPKNCNE